MTAYHDDQVAGEVGNLSDSASEEGVPSRAGERVNCLLYWYKKANDPGWGRMTGIGIPYKAFLCP